MPRKMRFLPSGVFKDSRGLLEFTATFETAFAAGMASAAAETEEEREAGSFSARKDDGRR